MTTIQGKYFKVKNRILSYATAELEVKNSFKEGHIVTISTEKIPFGSQGSIEGGYDIWNDSAEKAISVALEHISQENQVEVTVRKLEGRILIDTNNACVGNACIIALCDHFSYQLSTKQEEIMDILVKDAWKNAIELILNFDAIFK